MEGGVSLIVTPNYNPAAWEGATAVTGSDFTTTSTALVDITGLVSPTLVNAATYEIAVVGMVKSSSNAGLTLGVHGGGSGSAATCFVQVVFVQSRISIVAIDTASTAISTSSNQGTIILKGFVTTRDAGTATISVQVAKVTSQTATVYIGTTLYWRRVA
jgi:hypothetical protein